VEQELHSAFTNLIANAVRYSPNGGEIVVRWFRSADGPRFEVKDEGIGIPPEHISRITERFYRVDLKGERVRGGTGLGLAIVKHVLKRHETTLRVESTVGKGSLFFCVFPRRRGQPIAVARTSAPASDV
jgi:two-component system, OmpR family, phosphate regulon sensor histidine kinase PhoR